MSEQATSLALAFPYGRLYNTYGHFLSYPLLPSLSLCLANAKASTTKSAKPFALHGFTGSGQPPSNCFCRLPGSRGWRTGVRSLGKRNTIRYIGCPFKCLFSPAARGPMLLRDSSSTTAVTWIRRRVNQIVYYLYGVFFTC